MKSLRTIFFSAVLFFAVSAASVQQAHAVLPVIVYSLARQAVVMTAESVAIGVIAKGFAANDPYVRTTATIGKSRLASNMASHLRGPGWVGLASFMAALAGLGWIYDENMGLVTIKTDHPRGGFCAYPPGGPSSAEGCFAAGKEKDGYTDNWTFVETKPVVVDCGNMPGACPDKIVKTVSLCVNSVIGNNCSGATVGIYRYYDDATIIKTPVPASQIEALALPRLAASPNTWGDFFAGANSDMLNKLLDGATVPYNATNPTPEIAQLKSDYRNGLLQAVDPDAPHYVTPELLRQIQDLVAAEDAANTDDGTVEALNGQMKQPITQAQYEESNKKFSDAVDSVTSSLPNNNSDMESIDDSFNKLDGIITDLPNTNLPAPADISVPQYVGCQQLTLSDGNGHELVFPSPAQCAKIETFKEGFGYFLAVSVVFLLGMQLLTRPHG